MFNDEIIDVFYRCRRAMLSDEWLIQRDQIVVRWDRQRGRLSSRSRLSARSRHFATVGSALSTVVKATHEPSLDF